MGRWFAIGDAFAAMTTDRPYRAGPPPVEALRRLREGRGTQFAPEAVLPPTAILPSGVENIVTPASLAIENAGVTPFPTRVDAAFAATPLPAVRSR